MKKVTDIHTFYTNHKVIGFLANRLDSKENTTKQYEYTLTDTAYESTEMFIMDNGSIMITNGDEQRFIPANIITGYGRAGEETFE